LKWRKFNMGKFKENVELLLTGHVLYTSSGTYLRYNPKTDQIEQKFNGWYSMRTMLNEDLNIQAKIPDTFLTQEEALEHIKNGGFIASSKDNIPRSTDSSFYVILNAITDGGYKCDINGNPL
jgi:hypothetical protein